VAFSAHIQIYTQRDVMRCGSDELQQLHKQYASLRAEAQSGMHAWMRARMHANVRTHSKGERRIPLRRQLLSCRQRALSTEARCANVRALHCHLGSALRPLPPPPPQNTPSARGDTIRILPLQHPTTAATQRNATQRNAAKRSF
jgi:hypothetical protein